MLEIYKSNEGIGIQRNINKEEKKRKNTRNIEELESGGDWSTGKNCPQLIVLPHKLSTLSR